MLRANICSFVLFLLLAGPVLAGPWAREAGGTFLSLTNEYDREHNNYTGFYSEYGLSARNTLGFELGYTNEGETNALVWFQRALDKGQGSDRWTVSLGFGAIHRDAAYYPVGQVATSWGRGFDTIPVLRRVRGGGWLSAETRFKIAGVSQEIDFGPDVIADETSYLTPEMTTKADVTMGWHATPSLMVINQFRFEDRDDTGFSSKLATSVVRDLVGQVKIELGIVMPLSGPGERALKLGSWLEF